MERKELKKIDGSRRRFRAKVGRLGEKRGFRGATILTVLFTDVRRVDTGEVVADHI